MVSGNAYGKTVTAIAGKLLELIGNSSYDYLCRYVRQVAAVVSSVTT